MILCLDLLYMKFSQLNCEYPELRNLPLISASPSPIEAQNFGEVGIQHICVGFIVLRGEWFISHGNFRSNEVVKRWPLGNECKGELWSKNRTGLCFLLREEGHFLADQKLLHPLRGHCLLFYYLPHPVLKEGRTRGNKDHKIQSLTRINSYSRADVFKLEYWKICQAIGRCI